MRIEKSVLTYEEAACVMGWSIDDVKKKIDDNEVDCIRNGRSRGVCADSLERWKLKSRGGRT